MAFTAIFIMMAASVCGAVIVDRSGDVEESDAIVGVDDILFIAAFLFCVSMLAYEIYKAAQPVTNGADQESINEAARLEEATKIVALISNALKEASAFSGQDAEMMGFTGSYFERMGEIAAAELWSQNGTMNSDSILLDSTICENYATILLNYMSILNDDCDDYKDRLSEWANGFEGAYADMTLSYSWTGGSITATSGEVYNVYGIGTTVTGTSDDVVYLYDGGTEKNGFVYVHGGDATITASNGTTYTLTEGRNDLSSKGIPNGMYTLQAGRSYIGSLSTSFSSNAADLHAATVMIAGNGGIAYAIENSTGTTDVYCNGTYNNVSELNYNINYDDTCSTVDLMDGMDAMRNLLTASNSIYSKTLNAASAAWSVFNTAGESSVFVSPSALIPNLKNMNFTSDQIYLIYMSALQQMSENDWTASANFTASDVTISEDSLDLTCYGTIYNASGTAIKSNVIFTPMCYLRDQAIRVGSIAWNQPGLAMLWTVGDEGTLTANGLVPLETGYTFTITKIIYMDETYTTAGDGLVLSVMSLTNLDGYDHTILPPTPVPHVTDYTIVAQILVMIIGAFIAYMGYNVKNPIVMIIGGIVIVIGWLFGAIIVGWFI